MAPNLSLKGTAATAAAGAERLVYSYPTRFSDIDAAKAYIDTICTKNSYTYGLDGSLSAEERADTKDRAHFLVAIKAFNQGEFYLDRPLPDRNALKKAVEADVRRVLQLIQCWPSHFFNVDMVLSYVRRVCILEEFPYTPFEGVESSKFRHYVHFHSARRGFQHGLFEMRWPLPEWVVKSEARKKLQSIIVQQPAPVLKPLDTLTDTIAADIARLKPLLPAWGPSFPHLNDARDFVSSAAWKIHFRYTGWADLEYHRFRLFVNYNTAKEAWQAGKFIVMTQPLGTEVVKREKDRHVWKLREKGTEKEDKGKNEERSTVSSCETLYGDKATERNSVVPMENQNTLVQGGESGQPLVPRILSIEATTSTSITFNADTLSPATSTSTDNAYDPFDPLVEDLLLDTEAEQVWHGHDPLDAVEESLLLNHQAELSAVTKDPFQDLLSDFARVGLLKAGFE